ncbi:MAG TPA: fumarylacetoacetate hydrolase family protein [Aliidongia sp.]|uniref:fumarylacetoacetate hydrolase family protein n=1 Tax=Aliidongia sp. TaxID=1914230 RepID=UPI002DDD1B48|nr:fumarylacetoacetate hydrolase family protein [Aliidongia sp.]HEV2675049.1 fumarylacetoacetate hydrolase family protein [Aliidongia sp.]
MSLVIAAPKPVLLPVTGTADLFPVRRVYCVGRNYAAHAREMGFDPDRDPPFYFCKPADAVMPVAEGAVLDLPYPSLTANYHYEAELVVAIGTGGANIPVEQALDHVWGYAVGLDMTRRDLQIGMREKGRPWEIGKAFDSSAPIGPLHPAGTVDGMAEAGIWLTVNDTRKQDSNVSHLIWSVPETIADLSRYFRLEPGDLIYTGTPEGVGAVVAGDLIVVGVDGLGTISARVVTR